MNPDNDEYESEITDSPDAQLLCALRDLAEAYARLCSVHQKDPMKAAAYRVALEVMGK